jgi:probable phosphomutase (TIGR03848 family)
MTVLMLIRHGENDYLKQNRLPGHLPDIHLNTHGREQAEALAESLKTLRIRAIYSSPLERAIETAEPLAQRLGLAIQLRPGLTDTNVGDWEGRLLKDLRKLPLWKQVQEMPSQAHFPGGESILETQKRVVREIDIICQVHKPKEMVAVVFHADPIKAVLAHFLGLPLDNFQKLWVATGSLSVLRVGKSGGVLAALNLSPPFVIQK